MICYAIKNKDLYKTTNTRCWTKDIRRCALWDSLQKAKDYLMGCYLRTQQDCKIVKVEIKEIEDGKIDRKSK